MKFTWNFQGDGGPIHGGGMDIFWNYKLKKAYAYNVCDFSQDNLSLTFFFTL